MCDAESVNIQGMDTPAFSSPFRLPTASYFKGKVDMQSALSSLIKRNIKCALF